MAIRIPQNQIQYKYTSGKEYMELSTYREYQGYYYELKGKIYAGKEFNSNASELIPIPKDNTNTSSKFNSLLTNSATYVYGRISGAKIHSSTPSSHMFKKQSPNDRYVNRYFCQKINTNPPLIKEINEDSYKNIQNNPIYKSIMIQWDTIFGNEIAIDKAEKEIPGIKDFLQDLNFDPLSDIDEYPDSFNPLNPPSI